jgi:hypothetical protein
MKDVLPSLAHQSFTAHNSAQHSGVGVLCVQTEFWQNPLVSNVELEEVVLTGLTAVLSFF